MIRQLNRLSGERVAAETFSGSLGLCTLAQRAAGTRSEDWLSRLPVSNGAAGTPLLDPKEFLLFKALAETRGHAPGQRARDVSPFRTLGRAVESTKRNAFCATAASLVSSPGSNYFSTGLEAHGSARSGVLFLVSHGSTLTPGRTGTHAAPPAVPGPWPQRPYPCHLRSDCEIPAAFVEMRERAHFNFHLMSSIYSNPDECLGCERDQEQAA